jgi:hypothetical protein
MSSEGTGAPISLQDALDLLHKLNTESTRVQALFTGTEASVRSSLVGVIRRAQGNILWVTEDPDRPGSPFLAFDPTVSVIRKYGDERAMLNAGEGPFGFRFRSLLILVFKDGSILSLFEFADTDDVED